VGRLDPVFKAALPVREAQIIQEAFDTIRIRYVPAADFSLDSARSMVERLQDRMGQVQVILESMNEIPRTANGKFRAVICRVPLAEIERRLRAAAASQKSQGE
jgi:phenylacetate-CoA ligase